MRKDYDKCQVGVNLCVYVLRKRSRKEPHRHKGNGRCQFEIAAPPIRQLVAAPPTNQLPCPQLIGGGALQFIGGGTRVSMC